MLTSNSKQSAESMSEEEKAAVGRISRKGRY